MPNAKKKTALRQVEPEKNFSANSAVRRIVFISHSNPEDNDFTTWLAARSTRRRRFADRDGRRHGFNELNLNACIKGDGLPVTLRFASAVAEILTAGPTPENQPPLPFKHYI